MSQGMATMIAGGAATVSHAVASTSAPLATIAAARDA
jgi:hypothetical protein